MATVTLSMNTSTPQPHRMLSRVCTGCLRVRRAAGRFWRKYIADEDPGGEELVRRKRIDNIMHDVVLMEAMRRWEQESKAQEVSKDGPPAAP
jgi:hypothetical protein